MLNMTKELKDKLLAAQSAEEAAALVKAAGQELTPADAARLSKEIANHQKEEELSLDELDSVSGGSDRDWFIDGCAATMEPGSWCWSNDFCYSDEVTYDNRPMRYCEKCGALSCHIGGSWSQCTQCGHKQL